MFQISRVEIELGGRKLVLESGKIARQADGAVVATYGDTTVLCTAVGARAPKPGVDFFPADGELPGKDFCRRQDSWRLF